MKEAPDLILRQSVVGGLDGFADTVSDGIASGRAEKEGGTGVAVIPYGEGSLEMGQADDGRGVQGSVDGAETEDLGFGAAGGGAAQAGPELAQGRIAVLPEFAGSSITAEEDFGVAAAQSRARRSSPTTGARSSALRLPPSGRHLLRCTQVQRQRLAKPFCASVRRRFWASSRWVMWAMRLIWVPVACSFWLHIERGEMAAVPGAAEQRRQVSVAALEGVEDGGELFRKSEQAAVGGRLLIAQSMRRGHWRSGERW